MKGLVLVKIINKQEVLFTTSEQIAEKVELKHKNVIELICKHKVRLERRGLLAFKTERTNSNRESKCYHLTERQATLLVTFMKNTDIVADFKEALIDEFLRMKEFIKQKQTNEWIDGRKNSKEVNHSFTDAVQSFVEHAISQGSNNYKRYYKIYSDLLNKCLGIKSGNRDNLSIDSMHNQKFISKFLSTEIYKGIQDNINYKQIYQNCKYKVEYFIECFGLKLKA